MVSALELQYHAQLSIFAYNFNLRRCTKEKELRRKRAALQLRLDNAACYEDFMARSYTRPLFSSS
jgi:hypothetical protein